MVFAFVSGHVNIYIKFSVLPQPTKSVYLDLKEKGLSTPNCDSVRAGP